MKEKHVGEISLGYNSVGGAYPMVKVMTGTGVVYPRGVFKLSVRQNLHLCYQCRFY